MGWWRGGPTCSGSRIRQFVGIEASADTAGLRRRDETQPRKRKPPDRMSGAFPCTNRRLRLNAWPELAVVLKCRDSGAERAIRSCSVAVSRQFSSSCGNSASRKRQQKRLRLMMDYSLLRCFLSIAVVLTLAALALLWAAAFRLTRSVRLQRSASNRWQDHLRGGHRSARALRQVPAPRAAGAGCRSAREFSYGAFALESGIFAPTPGSGLFLLVRQLVAMPATQIAAGELQSAAYSPTQKTQEPQPRYHCDMKELLRTAVRRSAGWERWLRRRQPSTRPRIGYSSWKSPARSKRRRTVLALLLRVNTDR